MPSLNPATPEKPTNSLDPSYSRQPRSWRSFGKILNRPLELIPLSSAAASEGMLRMGMPAEIVEAALRRTEISDHGTRIWPTVEEVTGHAQRSFADWAQAHLDAFRRMGGPD